MPLPTPQKGIKQSDFISKCMGSRVMEKEFPRMKQRLAVCYSRWRKKKA